jgi:hypothetical protein
MTWTLLVATAARNCLRRRTATLLLRRQGQQQRGGEDKRLLVVDGVLVRRRLVVALGEALRPVEEAVEEAPGGVRVQALGLGHPPQQVDGGVPTQLRQVRGGQEAAAGEQVAQVETTPDGAAPIRRRKAAGTCNATILLAVLPIS